MLAFSTTMHVILEDVLGIGRGERLLILSDTNPQSMVLAHITRAIAASGGAETVLAIMAPMANEGEEPSHCVAAAMKKASTILEFAEGANTIHSSAHREALSLGARHYVWNTDLGGTSSNIPISLRELRMTGKRTEDLAEKLTKTDYAKLVTPHGTDLTMSLRDRVAIPIHPLSAARSGGLPFYAEAAISPVEGSTEGTVVVDASVRGWGYLLRAPISFTVKGGRVETQSIVSPLEGQAERLKNMVLADANAANCAAELGIGCSRIEPRILRGDFSSDYAMLGNVHIAIGRNDGIGGSVLSRIHNDLLMTEPSLVLDGELVLEKGVLRV